jgi:hypothetical protein
MLQISKDLSSILNIAQSEKTNKYKNTNSKHNCDLKIDDSPKQN